MDLFPRRTILFLSLLWILFLPLSLRAQVIGSFSPVAVAVSVVGSEISYGDIIDFDTSHNAYLLSQLPDDPYIFGVAIENPSIVLTASSTNLSVIRSGSALVNVTLEQGAIKAGDSIVASSIPGKGMRGTAEDTHSLGQALEPFDGSASSTAVSLPNGKTVAAGTIVVQLNDALGLGDTANEIKAAKENAAPEPLSVCAPILKCMPLGTFMRYLTAALVAFGSVYFAFRSFMADAISGVTSIGRNPRAKTAIQGMVIFNATLAVVLALAGLAAGVAILFIQL